MKNPEWRTVWVCLGLAVVFFALIFVSGGDMAGIPPNYAVMFLSIFLFICSLAVAALFFTRARATDEVLSGKDLLAHWTYPDEVAARHAEKEYARYRETNRGLLGIVGGFLVIAMVLVVIFGGEAGVITAGILFAVLIIITIASVLAPWLEYRRAARAPREAYITNRGIIYEGMTYPFRSFLMRMKGVRFKDATAKEPPYLVFSFVQLVNLYILRPFDVSIPVPAGEEASAWGIARRLGGIVDGVEGTVKPGNVCTACGAFVKTGDPCCTECGRPVGDGQNSPALTCPGCGAQVGTDAKFCESCGYRLK